MIPVFIRGHLSLTAPLSGDEPPGTAAQILEYENINISVSGVTGLPWTPLSPDIHFGLKTAATIRVPGSQPGEATLTIRTTARVTREQTQFARHMGLRFFLELAEARNLASLIARSGFFPTEYLRKYPRIPSLPMIQTFPLKAIDLPDDTNLLGASPVSFDVLNISPNGILLSSESPLALDRTLGTRMRLVIEPRGWFPIPIKIEGMVCRVSDDIAEATGNTVRSLGIKFTKIEAEHQVAFLDLIRDIVERVKTIGNNPGPSS